MIEVIRQIEWIDIREYDQEKIKRHQFCPICGAAKIVGHETWCKIKEVLEGEG